jgi:hypothetical protein
MLQARREIGAKFKEIYLPPKSDPSARRVLAALVFAWI